MDNNKQKLKRNKKSLGLIYGMIFGGGVGTILFALTDNPIWISMGPGIGMVIGMIIGANMKNSKESNCHAKDKQAE